MRFLILVTLLSVLECPNAFASPGAADGSNTCVQFSVLTQDVLKNVKEGLSPQDVKWFREKVQKKYPAACYIDPSPTTSLVFVVIVTPDTYHGTRVVTNTETHDNPISGTVTDPYGDSADISGTEQTTTTSSTAVPYSFEYGIYTLSVEEKRSDGSFTVLHRFQQKGIYRTMYGIPLGGKGHHPLHAVIEEAAEWINKGGLAAAEKMYAQSSEPASGQSQGNGSSSGRVPKPPPGADAVLDISSTPSGAEIDVDGAYVGNTPAALQVTPGEHFITVKKVGYASWERKIKAMPGHASLSPELLSTDNPTTH